eukprot:Gb_01733 [translate_table: standard]
MAFGASQPHYGRLSGRSGGGYVEQSNAGNSSLQASNASSRGRKGQLLNANHLLNFQYDPIRRTPMRNPPPRRQQRIKPYNKDLFLQANFRFLVSDLGDYVLNSSNPDKMLQWEDVAAVKFSSSVPVQCPICLESPPLCPQITTCGHIFCFPCVLRYLLMGEEDHKGDCWKKCPLCSTVISCKDLHTVSISSVKHFQVGDYIDFTLLARAKSSVIPFEKNQYMFGALPYSKDGQCNSFSKFTLTSDAESSASMASLELTRWVHRVQSEGGEDLELLPYVYAATDQLEQRKKAWTEHRASESLNSSPPMGQRIVAQAKAGHSKFPFHGSNEYDKSGDLKIDRSEADTQSMKVRFGGAKSETVGIEMASTDIKDESTVTDRFVLSYSGASDGRKLSGRPVKCNANFSELLDDEDKESDKSSQKHKDIQCLKNNQLYKHQCEKSESVDEDSYYFYQSADGQSLVLHPLNMKCLLHHYGSHDMLPSRIGGKILQMEMITQSEAMRKRYRYLSHFPLTTTFQLCEIDLSNLLPASAFLPFSEDIQKRETQRYRRLKQEHEDRERSVAAAAVQARPILQEFTASIHDDKPPSSSDFEGGPKSASVSPPVFSELKLFSRVTRLGFAAGHDAPSLREDQSGGFSPGSSAFASKVTNIETVGHSSESGTSSPSPMSFADIIMTTPKTIEQEHSSPKLLSSGKKGKKSTKVLLSTAGGRRY